MVDTTKKDTGAKMVRVDYTIEYADELIKTCEYKIADLRDKMSNLYTQIEYNKGKIAAYEDMKSGIE